MFGGRPALARAREAAADRIPTAEAHEVLRAAAEGRGQRRFMGQCEVHGRAWSNARTGACSLCIRAAAPPRPKYRPALFPCEVHGPQRIWASTHGQCRRCYTRKGELKPKLPLAKATVAWWARHEAMERGLPRYMADCPQHGFSEHRTRLSECTRCRRNEPVRLRPL